MTDALDRLLRLPSTDRVAVEWRGRSLTYADLADAVDTLAETLMPRTNVLLLGPLCPAYVVALLASLRCGAVPMPVDSGFAADRYAWAERVSRPSVVVTSDVSTVAQYQGATGAAEILLDAATGRVALRTGRVPETASRYPMPDAGYLIPTSGSTGEPKAIVGSRTGLHTFLSWFVDEFGLNAQDRCAAVTRVNFDPSLRELLGVLVAGGTLCLPEIDAQLDPHALASHLATSRATLAFLVPSLARRVGQALEELPDLRLGFFAGEVLPSKVVEQWTKLASGAEFVNLYGMTEGTLAQLFRRGVRPGEAVPVGRPRPGVTVTIDDPDPAGRGEVLVSSDAPALGILVDGHVDPMPGVLRTGDVGWWTEDGELRVSGRLGNALKVSGKRVSFEQFVLAVEELPGVDQCVVVDHQGPHAFVATEQDAVRQQVLDVAKRLELPRPEVHLRARLPLMRSGKVDRIVLTESIEDSVERVTPDESVAGVLLGFLGLDAGLSTPFVDVGLSSLDMMDFVLEVNRRFGVNLTVHECFEYRDVASLARAIDHLPSSPAPLDDVRAAELPAVLPLSTRQLAYQAICMADGNANWCNISREISFDTAVSVAEVTAAAQALIARHDVLRLGLTPDWSAQVHTEDGLRCPITVHETGEDFRALVQEVRVRTVAELIDPTAAPPIRVAIVGTSVILVAHHLFVDGLSLDLLAAEFRALLLGQTLEAVPPQGFRDYCLATRRIPDAPEAKYWRTFLEGAEQIVLPEVEGASDGMLVSRPFGVSASRAAHRLAASSGVSLFSVVLAAFELAVAEEFGTGPLTIVVPVQVRAGVSTATAGMFMSQLVVRGTGAKSLPDNAREFAGQLESGAANSAWEFDQRVDELGLSGATAFPLSTVLFNQHPKPRGLRVRDLGSREPRELGRSLRYQLQGELQMSAAEIALTYYYRRGIAPDGTGVIDRIHARILETVCSNGKALDAH